MTFVDSFPYPDITNAFGDENDDHRHKPDRAEQQSLFRLFNALGSFEDVEIFPYLNSPLQSLSSNHSSYLNETAEEALQRHDGNPGKLDFFNLSPFPSSLLSSPPVEPDLKKRRLQSPSFTNLVRNERPTKLRRQNRSCDPCRSAKRACDLPFDPIVSKNSTTAPCTTCKLRGAECTVVWLMKKQGNSHANHSVSVSLTSPRSVNDDPNNFRSQLSDSSPPPPISTKLPSLEISIVSDFTSREMRSQRLGVYIDIFDFPVSNLLSGGCMPPCHALGITALKPLSRNSELAERIKETQLTVTKIWRMDSSPYLPASAIPRLFVTASILDMLFQCATPRHENSRFSSRDEALTEAFKWVAIATGSQFTIPSMNEEDNEESRQKARNIAYDTWRRARDMVFTRISMRRSFRLSLSLVLFGTILPPTGTDESHEFADESAYALQEGICRLRKLCSEARSYDGTTRQSNPRSPLIGQPRSGKIPRLLANLPASEYETVLELIAGLEWLVEISQVVAISISPSRSIAIASSFLEPGARSDEMIVDKFQELATNDLDDSIIARVKSETQSVTYLLSQNAEQGVVQNAVNESGSLVVLLYKTLAGLTLAVREGGNATPSHEKIYRHINTMLMLIGIWRTAFGAIDDKISTRLRLATADLRRSMIFCAIDGDLAILLFHKLCSRIQKQSARNNDLKNGTLHDRLAETKSYRRLQRLTSAIQISSLASAVQGNLSPGVEGAFGLKAQIEDIRAHPVSLFPSYQTQNANSKFLKHPSMVVQAYKLAANCLADEIQNSITAVNEKLISDLSIKLQNCLRELRGLQSTLVMYPSSDVEDDDSE